MKNKFIALCGPSGVGKSSLIEGILKDMGKKLIRTVSYTTRKKRLNELHGKDYFFISKEEFFKKRKNGEFIEWTYVYNDYYATSKSQIQSCWKNNKAVIKDLDIEGLKSVKKIYPQSLAVGVLVSSDQEIRKRIEKRRADFGENRKIRLDSYVKEVEEIKKLCSLRIFNDYFEKAVLLLKKEIEKYLSST